MEVFKETKEDWYPSYKIYDKLLLRVGFLDLSPFRDHQEQWRVCVWGADDCGMEKDFIHKQEAWECFLEVVSLDFVSRNQLIAIGFRMA